MLDTAIIGGGLCGLTLARYLHGQGKEFALFEARARLGGRIYTVTDKKSGLAIDLGPTWFWPDARVVHHRAHTTARTFGGEPFERLAEARREVIARRLGTRRAGLDDAAQAVTFLSRIAAKRLLGRPSRRELRQLEALRRARHR